MNEQLNQLLRYVEGIWIYRWPALLVAWLVALAGWLFVFTLPNVYQAGTIINVDTYSIIDPLLKGMTVDLNAGNELGTVTKMLLGRKNLEAVLQDIGIDRKTRSPAEWERLIDRLRRDVRIEYDGGGDSDPHARMYGIYYKAESASRAYRVVSILSNSMIDNSLKAGRTDVAQAEQFLDDQIAEYEKRLTLAEQRLADFKKKNVGLMPDEKGSYYAHIQKGMDDVERTRMAIELAKRRQAELRKQLSGESPLINSGTDTVAAKLSKAEAQLADLLDRYTEEHPDVQRMRSRIAKLKAGIDVGGGAAEDGTNNRAKLSEFNPVYQELKMELSKADIELESLKSQLADQERTAGVLKNDLDTIPEVEAQLSRLNRDYEVTKTRYLDLVARRESAQLSQEAKQHNSGRNFRIVEPAVVPVFPSGPNRLLLLSGVLAAAIGAGVGVALLLVMLRRTFMGSVDVKRLIGLPVLGTVSLNLKPAQRKAQQAQLAVFTTATVLLLCIYGGALVYRDAGAPLFRGWVHDSGIHP